MTVYTALWALSQGEKTTPKPGNLPTKKLSLQGRRSTNFGWVAIPENPGARLLAYGITGSLDNQWFLHCWDVRPLLKAYAVVLFDWRAR